MTEIFVVGKQSDSSYVIDFETGPFFFPLKLDTGAKYTVISAKTLKHDLDEGKLERLKEFCESQGCEKELFVSASGGTFWGYLTSVSAVRIGSSRFHDFRFYLVVKNERDVSLLGFDFINKCKYIHEANGNFIMSQFDDVSYKRGNHRAMKIEDVVSCIDSL